MITYRADIDGLRAVAVLLVIAFHAGLPLVSGGFVGVDIFFVISGYLITSIIYREIATGKFTFRHFYQRRIGRILPALYAMSAITLMVGLFFVPPATFETTAKAGLAALFFSSNIFFTHATDYFEETSDLQPFLHTWSLGIEEQYYLFFPLILVVLIKHPQYLKPLLALLFLATFSFSTYNVFAAPLEGYYLITSRAWELLAGSWVALYPPQLPKSTLLRQIIALIASLFIVVPAVTYSSLTAFPGIAALPVVLGAITLLRLGQEQTAATQTTKLLSHKRLVGIGLISYSLYLWHWPIFALWRNYYGRNDLPAFTIVAALLLTSLAAYLSWRFIERPFRDRNRFTASRLFILASAATITLSLVYAGVARKDGLPSVNRISISDPCLNPETSQFDQDQACVFNATDAHPSPSVILWGDSHVLALEPAYQAALKEANIAGEFSGLRGCPPLPGIIKTNYSNRAACLERNDAVLSHILRTPSITTVILHARWALFMEGSRYREESGDPYILQDRATGLKNEENNRHVITEALERLVSELHRAGKQIMIIGPTPEAGFDVARYEANRWLTWRNIEEIRPTYADFRSRQQHVFPLLKAIAQQDGVSVIYPHILFCKDSEAFCLLKTAEGKTVYRDDDHLSTHGAMLLVPELVEAMFKTAPSNSKTTDEAKPRADENAH